MYDRSYTLDQYDYIDQSIRSQEETWTEKIVSWGVELHFSRFDLKYTGRVISGSGIPSVSQSGIWRNERASVQTGDFIVAPSGSMNIDERSSYTHQFLVPYYLAYLFVDQCI